MSDYTTIGNAIKTTLLADSWLGNTSNVKTIETHKRGFSVQATRDAQFFQSGDLPAIAVVPNAQPKTQAETTTNEIEETVRAQVITISRDRDPQAGLTTHQTIVRNVERVLEAQKSSAKSLGIDAFVSGVSTSEGEPLKDGDYYYFVSTTDAQILMTATF